MKELLLFVFLPQLSIHFWREVHYLIKHSAGTKISFFKELRHRFNYVMHDYTVVVIFGIFVPLISLHIALQVYYANRYIDNFPELYI